MGAFVPGDILVDRYRVERHLGQGTTSDVYLALDFVTETQVALKYLRISGERATARFTREATTLEKLHHRSIVRIHAHHDVPPLLVMELLVGRTLAAQLAAGDPPGRYETRAIGRSIAGALVQVHGAGLVHRDVKPSNVLLARDRVVLFDFGLVTGAAVLTSPGQLLGTLSYLAPEVFLGKAATAATDIYALGCVLHELLLGVPPEVFSLRAPLREAAERAVERGRVELPPSRDDELATLVAECLDPDPDQRPSAKRIFTKLSESTLIRAHG